MNFAVEREQRSAVVYTSNTTSLSPAIIYFHGRGGTAVESETVIDLHTLWPEAYVVYAEGTNFDNDRSGRKGWQVRFPHVVTQCNLTKDVTYVKRLRAHLASTNRVDEKRIYAVGHSSGGFFTLSLMEIMPTFRAFAALGSYARYKVNPDSVDCSDVYSSGFAQPLSTVKDWAKAPRPVLYMFGNQDVAFGNGYNDDCSVNSKSRVTLEQLLIRNRIPLPHCASTAYMRILERQHFVPNEPGGATVQFQIYNNDHSWPADASQWVVDFFKGE